MTTVLPMMFVSVLFPLGSFADRVIESAGTDAYAEAEVRAAGPGGLELLIEKKNKATLSAEQIKAIDAAIDRVAGQRYGHVSRLYWYTDLEAAKAEAARTNKSILSLRMLGKLTDELSCANSRFFRTVLYADPQVASAMRDRFVMHWSSERDVPVITIDFGDGRIIRRTVTGNSAHYVLDANGRVLDAIPGLYSPAAFIEQLRLAPDAGNSFSHAVRAQSAERLWSDQLTMVGMVPKALARKKVPAGLAVQVAVTKASIEAPMVIPAQELKTAMTDAAWDRLVKLSPSFRLSPQSLALIRAENPSLDRQSFDTMISRLVLNIRRDTMQNEYLLHREIHQRLADQPQIELAALNAWIYSELFATPRNDPWLGLHDDTIYTGLDNAGIHR